MRREELVAAIRRARVVAALRAHPDRLVAFVLGLGVLAMVLHWR